MTGNRRFDMPAGTKVVRLPLMTKEKIAREAAFWERVRAEAAELTACQAKLAKIWEPE